MNRTGILAASLPVCAFLLTACSGKTKELPPKPNIILIVADDLGYADLGCYGQKRILTPAIDSLAANGMQFTAMYAGAPVSAPSRSVMFTGYHSGHTFVRGNMQAKPYGQLPLPDTCITVAEYLKTSGYKTALMGKWGLGVENTTGDPQGQGFDEFYGYYCQVHAHNAFPAYLFRNSNKEILQNTVQFEPAGSWSGGMGSYATVKKEYANDLICKEGLNYIRYYSKKDFFLCLTFTIPHINGEAPAGQRCEAPDIGVYKDSAWTADEKAYAASITQLDSYVRRIVASLVELGIDKKTLLIVTSDNGAELNHVFASNGLNRGYKRDVYEGGIRVPFIASMPGTVPTGAQSNLLASFQDFLPTACELARVRVPFPSDGISLVKELKGRHEEQTKHPYLYWEFHELNGKQALRKENWKAVRNDANYGANAPVELYDMEKDPYETTDIALQHPKLLRELDSLLRVAHTRSAEFTFNWEMEQ